MMPVLLMAPVYQPRLRSLAIPAILGLHLGFQCFINLGCFSWAMMSFTPYLLSSLDWELFARLAARRPRPLTLVFDAGCGVCFQIARLVARLDRLGNVRFVSSADKGALPKGIKGELLGRTIVVVEGWDTPGRMTTRADAVATVLRALPAGVLWSFPLRVPGLRQLANLAYDAFARRRTTVSTWLGLAACGVPGGAPVVATPSPEPSPFRLGLRRVGATARELGVVVLLVTLVYETLMINAAVPKFMKPTEPKIIQELVAYPRLIQAWSMFASDAPMSDESVVVDAVTVDGRHVDPYSEISSRYKDPGHDVIPPRLDNDSFFFNYSSRIPFKGEYFTALQEWVLRYPDRTGRPADAIVKFDAWIVEDDSPPPGELVEHNRRSRIFFSYPPHK